MSVSELRCTSCLAPIDPTHGPIQRCVYCGAALVVGNAVAQAAGVLRLEDCGPSKIAVIKLIRQYTGLGLKEAKDLADSAPCVLADGQDPLRVEQFREELVRAGARTSGGASAAKPPVQAPGPPTAGVFLEHCGPNKISVIKVIREHTGLGLKESKDLADSAPCVIAEGCDAAHASRLRHDLVAVGARIR